MSLRGTSQPRTGESQLRACRLGHDHQLGELRLEGPRPMRHCKTKAEVALTGCLMGCREPLATSLQWLLPGAGELSTCGVPCSPTCCLGHFKFLVFKGDVALSLKRRFGLKESRALGRYTWARGRSLQSLGLVSGRCGLGQARLLERVCGVPSVLCTPGRGWLTGDGQLPRAHLGSLSWADLRNRCGPRGAQPLLWPPGGKRVCAEGWATGPTVSLC